LLSTKNKLKKIKKLNKEAAAVEEKPEKLEKEKAVVNADVDGDAEESSVNNKNSDKMIIEDEHIAVPVVSKPAEENGVIREASSTKDQQQEQELTKEKESVPIDLEEEEKKKKQCREANVFIGGGSRRRKGVVK